MVASTVLATLAPPANAQVPPTVALPEQVHVTLAEDGGLVIQWAVVAHPYGATEAPLVRWSIDGAAQTPAPAALAGEIVPRSGTSASGVDVASTYVYAATIAVPPGATVTYDVGSTERGFRGPYTTRNVPAPDSPLRFLAYRDNGLDQAAPDGSAKPVVDLGDGSYTLESPGHAVRALALQQKADLLIIPGDLAYANQRSGWDTFMRFMEPVQATVPTMPAAGNHEHTDDVGYSQFLNEYVLPGDEERFMFRAGPVTFIAMNSDSVCAPHDAAAGPPQDPCRGKPMPDHAVTWFENALIEASTDETPWTVVYFHHPLYSFGRHGGSITLQFLWGGLMEKYGVDVVVNAHDHLYSRTFPIVDNVVTRVGNAYTQGDGPVYVVTGGGGRGLYDMPDGERPDWFAHAEESHHLTVWDVDADSLRFRAVRANDGTEFDAFTITLGTASVEGVAPVETPGVAGLLALVLIAGAAWVTRKGR